MALHIGTLIAVVAYFRGTWPCTPATACAWSSGAASPSTPEGRLAWLLVLSSIPAFLVGGLFGDTIDEKLGTIPLIAVSLIVFGLLLGLGRPALAAHPAIDGFTRQDALLVGAAQVLALNPGTSRSGITITASRFLIVQPRLGRPDQLPHGHPGDRGRDRLQDGEARQRRHPRRPARPDDRRHHHVGPAGWLAVWGTIKYVRTHSFTPFVIYRVALGLLVLVIYAAR